MKNLLKNLLLITSIILTVACTKTGAGYIPIVDTNNPNFEQDLLECQRLAKSYKDFGYDTAVKTGSAAGIGAGVGQMVGRNTSSTLIGAGIGLAASGTSKLLDHNDDRKDIIKRCLSDRGYRVLK